MITTDQEFRSLIPPLTQEEYQQLEKNILKDGCRDAIVIWNDVIVDGHNRYEICGKHDLPCKTASISFLSRDDAMVWIIDNQRGRRNLPAFVRTELELKKEAIIAKKAKAAQARKPESVYHNSDKQKPVHVTKEIAAAAKVSHDTVHKVKTILEHATEATKAKLRAGDDSVSINQAYQEIKKEKMREIIKERITDLKKKEVAPPTGLYDVIVIDPPWPMEKIEREVAPNQMAFDYPTMSEEELKNIKIPHANDCHFWVWTTHKFLPMALRLINKWGFKYVCTFVWHKNGGFQPFGLPQYNCEFAIYARLIYPN